MRAVLPLAVILLALMLFAGCSNDDVNAELPPADQAATSAHANCGGCPQAATCLSDKNAAKPEVEATAPASCPGSTKACDPAKCKTAGVTCDPAKCKAEGITCDPAKCKTEGKTCDPAKCKSAGKACDPAKCKSSGKAS